MKVKLNIITKLLIIITLLKLTKCQEKPALKIQLNPPEQDAKDTIQALRDLAKLENEIRLGMNEDYEEEKKKLIEMQKVRIHDIVHGAFIGLQTLIPNPVKASVNKAIRDKVKGESTSFGTINTKASEDALDNTKLMDVILNLKKKIKDYSN